MKQVNFLATVIFRDDAPIPNFYAIIPKGSADIEYIMSVAAQYDSIVQLTAVLDRSSITYDCIRIDEITHIHQN